MIRSRHSDEPQRATGTVSVLGALALCLAASPAAFSQGASQRMVFDHLSIEDGLSQGTVTRVAQDPAGFIWIATESGLNRYDGSTVQRFVYDRSATGGLNNDYIWDIEIDAQGDLWLATDGGGVARFEQETAQFTHYRFDADDANSLSSDAVRSLDIDSRGAVWVGTRDAGLNRIDVASGEIERFDHPNPAISIPTSATVFDIIEAAGGTQWFATSAGLYARETGSRAMRRWVNDADDSTSLSDNTVIAVHEASDGVIWAGTYEGGLNAIDREAGTLRRYRADADDAGALANDYVRDILEDSDGRLWVATAGGLSLLDRDTNRFTTYANRRDDARSLGSSYVMTLFQDQGGVLWVGTRGAGVAAWNPRSWTLGLRTMSDLADSVIVAFAADGRGHVWIGTMGKGLQRLTLETGELTPASALFGDSFAGLRTMSLLLDSRGQLWVGTMANGVLQVALDSGRITRFPHDPANAGTLSAAGVMSLFETIDGAIWVGTFGGGANRIDATTGAVDRLDGALGDGSKLAQSRVTAIVGDGGTGLWFATDGDGLFFHDTVEAKTTQFLSSENDERTLSANRLYAVYHDADTQRLWIGTAGRGLDVLPLDGAHLTSPRFSNISMRNGLSDNVVYGIEPDARGHLWLSSNSGLMHFDPKTRAVRKFHTRHGLQGEEFNFGAHHRGPDGRLYFGGAGGFNAFIPVRVSEDVAAPTVRLAAIEIDNQAYAGATTLHGLRKLDLKHDQDIITFELAVPDYVDPAKNRIAYRLEGFDAGWVSPVTARRFTYTNLTQGEYRLHARAISAAGVPGPETVLLTLRVHPAPWATWWAYAGYALLLALTTWLSLRWYRSKVERDAEMERLAHSDPVTGLSNRKRFLEQVRTAIETHTDAEGAVAVLAVDFNHVQRINDSLGHSAGDRVLKALANRLMHTVASTCHDLNVFETARLNGDEFAVVIAGANAGKRAERLGGHIVQRFSETLVDDGERIALMTNVGVAWYAAHGSRADALVKNAQAAAHAARTDGNGRCLVYSDDIAERIKDRLTLERDLRQAILSDQFELYLQPKFDIKRQMLTGAEALIRWQHPTRGLVMPDTFIALAEETGMIESIGRWVIDAVARQIDIWHQFSQPVIPVAVNVSSVEFRTGNPARTIQSAAAEVDIDPSLIHVELTESVIMQDAPQTRAALKALRDMGCHLAVDDFGTGYSSLAYLRRFQLDTVKIDRAFISDITTSDEDQSICAAIIAMAHGLNLSVVAEGVETEAQLKCLARLGCDEVQGFLLGKPVPADQFAALFGARADIRDGASPTPFFQAS
ncbi:MAG: EAL domain-containing protein [Pseudomonadota bacterium]